MNIRIGMKRTQFNYKIEDKKVTLLRPGKLEGNQI